MRTLLLLAMTAAPVAAADVPTKVLSNDTIHITIRLPDAKTGFYRGTRFDWAGVIGPVEVHGKQLFLPWKETHNPENNDDITGPCDEFGMHSPLGFANAKEGGRFVKIGVGELTKGTDGEYAFWKKYAIAKAGEWSVTEKAGALHFRQNYSGDLGYGYVYLKAIAPAPHGFTIRYNLVNSGTKPIETDVYNHNFFNVAGASTGKGFAVEFPFVPKLKEPRERFAELTKLDQKTIAFTGELDQGSIYTLLEGFDAAAPASFAIRGGGIRMIVTGDKPLSKMALWGVKRTLCPEPYIAIKLAPGESTTWQWRYGFEPVK
jgi:hypothetical protein